MRAPVSVIIPTLDAGGALPATLAALGEGLAAGLIRELVISDGGSGDATRALAQAAGAVWVSGAPSRGGQLRRGADAAGGAWLLFLHADTVLQPGWAEVVDRHMRGEAGMPGPDERAAVFRLAFDTPGAMARIVAGWANLRTRAFGLPYGDQGLLITRGLYDAVGGFPDQPLMEDVMLARRLRGRIVMLDAIAETSAEKYRRQGWLRRGARNLWTLARFFAGVDPERLARAYRR